MIIEGNTIKAENGAVLKRKNSEELYGEEYTLGYSYYKDGQRLATPHLDTPEDFEEVLESAEALNIITGQI